MIMKPVGGKLLHKAYCMKHSLEQKAKVESERYGAEELKSIKQIRVGLLLKIHAGNVCFLYLYS